LSLHLNQRINRQKNDGWARKFGFQSRWQAHQEAGPEWKRQEQFQRSEQQIDAPKASEGTAVIFAAVRHFSIPSNPHHCLKSLACSCVLITLQRHLIDWEHRTFTYT